MLVTIHYIGWIVFSIGILFYCLAKDPCEVYGCGSASDVVMDLAYAVGAMLVAMLWPPMLFFGLIFGSLYFIRRYFHRKQSV